MPPHLLRAAEEATTLPVDLLIGRPIIVALAVKEAAALRIADLATSSITDEDTPHGRISNNDGMLNPQTI